MGKGTIIIIIIQQLRHCLFVNWIQLHSGWELVGVVEAVEAAVGVGVGDPFH